VNKRKTFFIGGLIIVLALGYLGYTAFQGAATYYYTVGELLSLEAPVTGETIKVNGNVQPGSLRQETGSRLSTFAITEGDSVMPVRYEGIIPDTFEEGKDVVVEGILTGTGVFEAETIILKCPSKYVPDGEEQDS
jgi:cytochrome c-type biogenesis protein CcmE